MVECETRTQGARIAALFARLRTQDRADQRGRAARASFRNEFPKGLAPSAANGRNLAFERLRRSKALQRADPGEVPTGPPTCEGRRRKRWMRRARSARRGRGPAACPSRIHALGMVAVPQALERSLERRVLALWGTVLGVEASVLDRDGMVVVEDHREFAAERRATIRTARGSLLLPAPAETQVALADPAAYSSYVTEHATGIGLLHYLADPPAGDRDPRVRVLDARDRPLLDDLQTAAGAAASEEAEVDVGHPLAIGITEGGRLLAIASLLEETGDVVDVGVLVDPAERRRRLGVAAVSTIAERAARSGRLIQYRCNLENEASARLAQACGFTLWGVLTIASRPD